MLNDWSETNDLLVPAAVCLTYFPLLIKRIVFMIPNKFGIVVG